MTLKLEKNVEKKLKNFYRNFFEMHDNDGIEIIRIGVLVFLQLIILWNPEPMHWIKEYGIRWYYAESVGLYSFILLWNYSQVYRFYNMQDYKKVNMLEILQYLPISKADLKFFWMKKNVLMGAKVGSILLVYHLIRAQMMWNEINAWNILLPIVFGFLIPVLIVNFIILIRK